MEAAEARTQKFKADEEKSFQTYMTKMETKLLISMIPPIENPDLLQTLLRSAFDAGVGSGTGMVLGILVESMFKDRKHP